MAVAPQAHAQGLELQRYRPVTPANRGFELEGTKPLGHLKLAASVDVNYASQMLKVTTLVGGMRATSQALDGVVAADVALGFGLWNRFEVALALPAMLQQSGETPPGAPAATSGVGDARLTVKARLLDPGANGLSLAGSLTATAPFGQAGPYINEQGLTVEPRAVLAFKQRGFQLGGRLGLRLREATSLLGTPVSHQLTFAVGADKRIARALHAIAEAHGATGADTSFLKRRHSPVEVLAGGRYHSGQLSFGAAAGLGVISGIGSPAWRLIASVAWTNDPPDADRDGVPDTDDRCPDDAEDRDGFEDGDGCPDPDNDRDGVLDAFDHCPLEPEDLDDYEDEDGCPETDNDGDGVPDAADKCPNEAEAVNGIDDADGCPDQLPDTDKDGDGVRDKDDACADDPEDIDGFEDTDGCPDPDNDKDGILDAEDKCPSAPETINGRADDDGCPDEGAPQVRIGEKELDVLQPVFFKTNRFRIRHRFFNILDQIALTLRAHPEIGRCAVEGHADATGPADWNKRLSMMRAESVVEYLVRRGVDGKRLTPLGQGDQKPWADNETEEGRARNRRVVFHIEGVWSSRPPSDKIKVMQKEAAGGEASARGGHKDDKDQEARASREDMPARAALPLDRTQGPTASAPGPTATPVDAKPAAAWAGAAPASTAKIPAANQEAAPAELPPAASIKAKTLREAVQLPSSSPPLK